MKKYIFALAFLGLPMFVFAQQELTGSKVVSGSSGTVPPSELVNYKKVTVLTSNGETVDMSKKEVSGGTVPVSELTGYQKIKFETALGRKMEFIKNIGSSGTVPSGEVSTDQKVESTTSRESVEFKNNIVVDTNEKISVQNKKVYVGGDEVKVMPDKVVDSVTSETGSSEVTKVELKKDTTDTNNQYVKYEVSSNQEVKILGLFKTNMAIKSTVDAETGSVTTIEKPWWKFLAF
jgi:hypothetical protein